jgi:hypothetical protein
MNEKVGIWEAVMAYFKILSEEMENLGRFCKDSQCSSWFDTVPSILEHYHK